MSYDLTAKVLRHHLPGLSGIDKAVLASIADMIGDAGFCFPSYALLSKRTGFARVTVIRAVGQLYQHGLISIEQTKNKSNKYRVLQDKLDQLIKKGKKSLKGGISKKPPGSLSDTSSGISKIPEGYQKDTLINKGKNNKEKIKNGATHSEIAEEHSAQVEENDNWIEEASQEFLKKVKKQTPLINIVENPSLPEDTMMIDGVAVSKGEKIYFAHDPADIQEVADLLATDAKGEVVLKSDKGDLHIHSSGPIPIAAPKKEFTSAEMEGIFDELLPLSPKEGQVMADPEGHAWIFEGGWWKALTPEQKMNLKVADVLQMPIKKKSKKPTLKPTPAMVWQWSVSEWLEEKNKNGNVDLTQKKKAQLNKAAKKINEAGYEWRPLIEFCVKHWLDFTTLVTKATGKQNYPAQPDIDYFLFHVNHVIGFWKDGIDTSIKKPKIKITKKKLTEKEMKKLTPAQKYNLEHGD